MDVSLFLLNWKLLCLYEMPMFFEGLFKAWTIFTWKRLKPTTYLFWLSMAGNSLVTQLYSEGRYNDSICVALPEMSTDCHELFLRGQTTSGVYTIQPKNSEPFNVFCEILAGKYSKSAF